MPAQISYITLGVDCLETSMQFYQTLFGWHTKGIVGSEYAHGAVVFFPQANGQVFALWQRESIAQVAGYTLGDPDPCGFLLAHNVDSAAAVDQCLQRALQAGAKQVKAAGPLAWGGYGAMIADPDGHLWEIVHNPDHPPANNQ